MRRPCEPFECDNEMVMFLLRFLVWVAHGHCKIIDRDNPGMPVPLRLRIGQRMVVAAMLDQALAGVPVRILVPKHRRHGISTLDNALCVFVVKIRPHTTARFAAHRQADTVEIFKIAKLMHFESGGNRLTKRAEAAHEIKPDGLHSSYKCESGTGAFTASGTTNHFLAVSELAKFQYTSAQDARAMESMLNSVSKTARMSMIVLESSGQGKSGVFPQRCRAAARDPKGSGWRCVFIPWLIDKALTIDEDELPDEFSPPLGGDELKLRAMGATDGQLAWRRRQLWSTYGDFQAFFDTPPPFGWEYPATMEECFGQRSGRVYPEFSVQRNGGKIDLKTLSSSAYLTRAIDWGGSEHHALAVLWVAVDPERPPGLMVDHLACPKFVEEHENYARNDRGKPIKAKDHTCLVGNTRVLVRGKGIVRLDQLVGTDGFIWTPVGWQPYWNCRQTSVSEPICRVETSTGAVIEGTEDHEILTESGWKALADVKVGDTLRMCYATSTKENDYESSHRGNEETDVYGPLVQPGKGEALLHQQQEKSASGGVEAPLGRTAKNARRAPSRLQPRQQQHRKPCFDAACGPQKASWFATLPNRDLQKESGKGKREGKRVASVGRRPRVACRAREENLEKPLLPRNPLRGMQPAVQDARPQNNHTVLFHQMQAMGGGAQTRYPPRPDLFHMPGLRLSEGTRARQVLFTDLSAKAESQTATVVSAGKTGNARPVYDLTVQNAHCFATADGIVASNCDALRILVATKNLRCFVYVYRELYITDPMEAVHQKVARQIHQLSGWIHPISPDHPDISLYRPGPDAELFAWGDSNPSDERFSWQGYDSTGALDQEFKRAIRMGAGVADAALYRCCLDFTGWGIPLIPHVRPLGQKGSTRDGAVEDGIAMVNVLIAGDTVVPRAKKAPDLASSAFEKLHRDRPVLPSDEEMDALRRRDFGSDIEDSDDDAYSWANVN